MELMGCNSKEKSKARKERRGKVLFLSLSFFKAETSRHLIGRPMHLMLWA